MPFPEYRIGSLDRIGTWLPAYARALHWTISYCLIVMGTGIALCGPIYAAMVGGVSEHLHSPLFVRANQALHEKVVARMTLTGLLLFGLGVVGLVIHQCLTYRSRSSGSSQRRT